MRNKLRQSEKNILDLIRINSSLRRIQISRLAGISLAKVAFITNSLRENGFIDVKEGKSSGGRKPKIFKIKNDLFYAMGIEINMQYIRISITNANGEIIGKKERYEGLKNRGNIAYQDIIKLGEEAIESVGFTWKDISVVGIGVVGIIDEKQGKILFLQNAPKWKNFEINKYFTGETGVKKVFLTESVKAMALAESRIGAGKEFTDFILFYIGVGLGTGIIIDRNLLKSSKGVVGEIGHIYVGEENEMCMCGNYGCLETKASGWAIIKKAKKAIKNGVYTSISDHNDSQELQITDITDAAKNGDKLAINLLEETAHYLSIGISTLINLLDPQAVMIAGDVVLNAGDILLEPLINGIKSRTLPWLHKDICIMKTGQDKYNASRGTAILAIDKFFKDLI